MAHVAHRYLGNEKRQRQHQHYFQLRFIPLNRRVVVVAIAMIPVRMTVVAMIVGVVAICVVGAG